MPTPITAFLPRNQNGTYPAANLPSTATTIKLPPMASIVQPSGSCGHERADIDRGPDDNEEDGHEEMPQRHDCLLDIVGLRRAAEQQPGGKGPDDRGRAGHFRAPGQAEGQQEGEGRQHARHGQAAEPSRQRRHEETAHHKRADEEAERQPP